MKKDMENQGTQPGQQGQDQAAQQPSAPQRGLARRILSHVLVAGVVLLVASMWWHGKVLGEAKAKAEGKTIAESRMVFPWSWTSDDWRGWYGNVENAAGKVSDKVSDKAATLQKRLADWQTARAKQAQPASTSPQDQAAASGPTADSASAAPTPGAPEGYDDAAKLVDEGRDAWSRHDYATARAKLTDARGRLSKMTATQDVTKALELTKDLLEDIDMNSPR